MDVRGSVILQIFLSSPNFCHFLLEMSKISCNFAAKQQNYGKKETDTIRNDELRGHTRTRLLLCGQDEVHREDRESQQLFLLYPPKADREESYDVYAQTLL